MAQAENPIFVQKPRQSQNFGFSISEPGQKAYIRNLRFSIAEPNLSQKHRNSMTEPGKGLKPGQEPRFSFMKESFGQAQELELSINNTVEG